MSMYYDIERERGNREICTANSFSIADHAQKIAPGHRSFLGPGSEKKWCGTHVHKPNGEWDEVAEIMMINLSESGHPVFRGSSAFESKGTGKPRAPEMPPEISTTNQT